jgi:hypothetical protein
MVYMVSCQAVTARTWFRSRFGLCQVCSGQTATGTSFLQSVSAFPVSIIPTKLLIHLCLNTALISING